MKVSAVVATLGGDRNGDRYTPECLQSIADQAVGLPITIEFDPQDTIGIITSAKVIDGRVEITGDIFNERSRRDGVRECWPDEMAEMFCRNGYLVPGIEVDADTKKCLRPFAFGLTAYRADKNVPHIVEVKE